MTYLRTHTQRIKLSPTHTPKPESENQYLKMQPQPGLFIDRKYRGAQKRHSKLSTILNILLYVSWEIQTNVSFRILCFT